MPRAEKTRGDAPSPDHHAHGPSGGARQAARLRARRGRLRHEAFLDEGASRPHHRPGPPHRAAAVAGRRLRRRPPAHRPRAPHRGARRERCAPHEEGVRPSLAPHPKRSARRVARDHPVPPLGLRGRHRDAHGGRPHPLAAQEGRRGRDRDRRRRGLQVRPMSRILRRSLVPVLLGVVLGGVFAFALSRVLDSAEKGRSRRELVEKLERLSPEFEEDLRTLAHPVERIRQAARQAGARVTLIAADGTVLGDSQVAPERLEQVENHASRPEVLAARRDLVGFGARTSTTVLEPFVYVARRVGPETAPYGYLRLAISQNELDLLEAPFRDTLYQVSLAAGLLVGLLVIVIRQRHANDLERVRAGVAEAAAGRHPAPPAGDSEETQEVFLALARFARLVAAEREGSEKARLLARTVFEQVPVGLLVVDRTLALLDANPAALALLHAPKYAGLYQHLTAEQLHAAAGGDQEFLISTSMAIVGVFTLLLWDALFPDRRDGMILCPMPVRIPAVFAAKLAALGAALGLAVVAVNSFTGLVCPFLIVPGASGALDAARDFGAFWLVILLASVFVFLLLLGVQGVALHLLPHALYMRWSSLIQTAAFFAVLTLYFLTPPLADPHALTAPENRRWYALVPSYWFFGLFQVLTGSTNAALHTLARRALAGVALAGLVAAGTYALAYARQMRSEERR